MKYILSPAKTLDFNTDYGNHDATDPLFIEQSTELIKELRSYSTQDIGKLMSLSEKLAQLNFDRYQTWSPDHNLSSECRQCILSFKGDVYQGLDVASWNKNDFKAAQKSLRILSGLYGMLRPLDLMHPYRLEMGTKLQTKHGKNLYQFWGSQITEKLNEELTSKDIIVNLASNEYFNAIDTSQLKAPIVTPIFKDCKKGNYKIISFYAKKARGLMASWAIKQRIKSHSELKDFSEQGYYFDAKSSTEDQLVFLRDEI